MVRQVANLASYDYHIVWYSFYQTTNWFMNLPDPTNAQAGFVSVIVGAGAGFFGIYVNGKSSDNRSSTNVNVK